MPGPLPSCYPITAAGSLNPHRPRLTASPTLPLDDGPVFSDDIPALQQALAGLLEDLGVLDRCSVVGGTECDILDIVTLGQALDQGGTLQPDFAAANP